MIFVEEGKLNLFTPGLETDMKLGYMKTTQLMHLRIYLILVATELVDRQALGFCLIKSSKDILFQLNILTDLNTKTKLSL